MISDENIANKINELMLRIGSELNDSVVLVQDHCDKDEFQQYRNAVGVVMGSLLFEVMRPLYEQHPRIKPKELL